MRIALIFSNSAGLAVSAGVIEDALLHHATATSVDLHVQQIKLPWQLYYRAEPVRFDRLKLAGRPDAILFLENIVECDPPIDAAIPTVLIPNPEWINARTERLLGTIAQVWHKSRFSREKLAPQMPDAEHHYTGFTSIDPGVSVLNYGSFAHFRGKATSRHSKEVLAVWKKNPHFPQLRYQFYPEERETDPFEFSEWLSWSNIAIRAGKLAQDEYFRALSESGIHLCTSSMEGFGHYINEARAMSAVAIVLDAPPMNELIDRECGILLSPSAERPYRFGVRYQLSEAELERGVEAVLAHGTEDLEAMGRNARQRFLSEREMFVSRIGPLFQALVQLTA